MWILRVNTVSQTYPKFIMKLNCWVKTGVGANLEAPKPPLNSSMAIHIRWLTTFFKVLYYLPIYNKDISETCHGIGKGVCRTNANRLIAEWQKDEKKNQKQKAEQAQKKTTTKKKKHEKSTAPSSVRHSPIQVLTGLALLNFTEKTRTLCFNQI